MIKNINQPATFSAPVPGIHGVKFPYVAMMALKSLRAWCDYRHSCNQTLSPTDDPNLDLTVGTVRLVMLGIRLPVWLTRIWFGLISWWTFPILLWSTDQLMMIW
jgi:hypothetical protein